jgi:dTMP kinase
MDQSQNGAAREPMTPQARGRFITLEGGEGVGKSVQAERLEKRLAALGLDVVRTREPGGSPGAEALREAILSGFAADFNPAGQALLFAAARVDHLDKTIVPALARGAWVVSDRFADSTRAYQGAAGNLPPDFIGTLERLTVGPNRPDLTLVLDLPPEIGLKRAAARRQTGPADRFESEGLAFHQTLRRAFLEIAAAEPERCVLIDADGSEEAVAAAIWSAVEMRLDPAGALKAKLA